MRMQKLLGITEADRQRVYEQIFTAAELGNLSYWLDLVFSAGIATLGLVLNSPAVVIGAMLISPLMGPLMSAGLALAAADLYLGLKAALCLLVSIVGAVSFSALLVWLLPFHAATTEILNRTQPNLLDLGVALFSGLAGSVVIARSGGAGALTALPGVAIAVALMPPLCTVGFGVGSGFQGNIIAGAGLLFMTNLAAIVASAFLVFYLLDLHAPEVRARLEADYRHYLERDPVYRLLRRTPLMGAVEVIGKLRWRVLMVAVALLVVYVPLRKGLMQVRDETLARSAVREAVRRVASPEAIVSEQVRLGQTRIRVSLVVTDQVDPARIEQARAVIMKRTGKDAELTVRKVAGEEELALLRERLRAPPEPAAPSPDLGQAQAEWFGRLQRAIEEMWPSDVIPLRGYELALTADGPRVRVVYESATPLEPVAEGIIRDALRKALDHPALQVELRGEAPAKPAGRRK